VCSPFSGVGWAIPLGVLIALVIWYVLLLRRRHSE